MSARRHERSFARRSAIQVLYMGEIQEKSPRVLLESGLYLSDDDPLSDYALDLIFGVEKYGDIVDDQIRQTSENWTLDRMPVVDRVILRLATYEMMYVDDVPISVSINEAVELAKEYGGEEDSHRFVNGVLGRIANRISNESVANDEMMLNGEAIS